MEEKKNIGRHIIVYSFHLIQQHIRLDSDVWLVVPMNKLWFPPEQFECNYREPDYQFLHSLSFIYEANPDFELSNWLF